MKPDTQNTDVIFRKWRSNNEIIALLPAEPGTNSFDTCMSYEHVGQHGPASVNLNHATTLAKPEEYSDLKQELESIGHNLRVCKRRTAKHDQQRREALNR